MELTSYLLGKKAGGGGSEPTGEISITSNGTHNVKSYATANVNVPTGITPTGTINITENGTSDVTNYASASVNVQPDLETKSITITENTTTTITPTQGKDGLSSVQVTTNVSGGGTDTRWQQIGYDKEPEAIQEGIDYAKQIMQNWDASISDRSNAFKEDKNLIYFPNIVVENVTNMALMFHSCYSLQYVDDDIFKAPNLTNMNSMFQYCSSLREVGDVNPDNINNLSMGSMFQYCYSLKKIKSISITKSSNNSNIFSNCSNLETIEEIRTTLTSFYSSNMFASCPKLSNNTLKVILNFLKQLTDQTSSKKTLSTFGLSQTQAELCTTFNEWTDLANAGWTTGY